MVESLHFIPEAWVKSSAAPTKALLGLITMVPQLAKLNSLYCKAWSYVGVPLCFPPLIGSK